MANSPTAPAIACGRLMPYLGRIRTPTSVAPSGVRDASQPAPRRPGSLRLLAGWRRLLLPAQRPALGDARSLLDGSPAALTEGRPGYPRALAQAGLPVGELLSP